MTVGTTVDPYAFIAAVLGILTLIIGVPLLRTRSLAATISLQKEQLQIERTERQAQEVRCREDVAELRGQVTVVTRDFARVIAGEVISVFIDSGLLPGRRVGDPPLPADPNSELLPRRSAPDDPKLPNLH